MAATNDETSRREVLSALAASYEQQGYAVIENFLSDYEVQRMRNEATRLIREESRSSSVDKRNVFNNELNMRNKYFVESGDKICYFFEKNAIDLESMELRLPEEQSLAKIGHALHCLNPVFRELTASNKVQAVYRAIGFAEPTVVQSMVIFKNPQVGGAYSPHQDASFLYAEPVRLAGVWLALDDATPANGCLEFIPGSHRWPLARRLMRADAPKEGENLLEWTAPARDDKPELFVKVPVKRGDLVLIDGLVVHKSAANCSDKPRWIYTFHAYDRAHCQYSAKNWLQTSASNDTFMPLYSPAA